VIGNRIEINALNADGKEFPIELAVGSARTSNGPIFIAFARDISDRKAKQEELRAAAERAQAGEKSKAAFLAVMSHEMRTPLNGVLGTLELMCDTPLDPRQRKLVETANASGELLLDLINNVLNLSKADAGKVELQPEQFDLRQVLEQLREMLLPSLDESHNRLSVTVDERIPELIEADTGRLRGAVINLLSNANKFTTRGAISLDCQLEELEGDEERALLRLSISDTGIGIPKDRIGELFQEFSQIDHSFRRRQGGTGLGLAITRRSAEAMGGEVGVCSTEGHGSTFWLKVPIRLCEVTAVQARRHAEAETSASRFAGSPSRRILLAEDNFTNAMVAGDMLESEGHTVVHVKNGRAAVAAAREGNFDLILMDISMPDMDGIEATMMIREHELTNGLSPVPIFALTANAMPDEVERFRKAGMNSCLTKPIRRHILVEAIASMHETQQGQVSEAEATMTENTETVPVIDHSVLIELENATNPTLVKRVLDKYLEEAASRLRDARAAAQAGNLVALQKMAHSLSGSSSTVGASRLQLLVATIEQHCIEGDGETALALAQQLDSVGSQTCLEYQNLAKARAA
jgi:signal transduction histidine kinase/DNA-binding response OmpR family regulator